MREVSEIILINLVLFFVLLLIHEASHVVAGYFLGCRQISVVLLDRIKGPHTEMTCPAKSISWCLRISGLIVTALLALPFLFFSSYSRNLFFLILGFSIILSASDFNILFGLESIFYAIVVFGFSFIAIGEYLTALNCFESSNYSI